MIDGRWKFSIGRQVKWRADVDLGGPVMDKDCEKKYERTGISGILLWRD